MIEHPCAPCNAPEQLAIEQALFDAQPTAACLRIWQPLPALIVTTAEANLKTFPGAVARAGERGLPVTVRRSGGGAVCLGPGMLVVTHLYASSANDIDGSYRQFAASLIRANARLGLAIEDAHVAAAYCDGKFDLAWRGLKVGGMAQRRRMSGGMAHVWIHAVLAVDARSLRYPEAVARFYSDVGSSRVADPGSTTSLSECLPDTTSAAGLLPRCAVAIADEFRASLNLAATWGRPSLPTSAE